MEHNSLVRIIDFIIQIPVTNTVFLIVSIGSSLASFIQESANTQNCLLILKGIKEVVITISAIIGSIVAIWGLKTWKAQIKGKTEYDLARRILKAVYKVRESINTIRVPFITTREIEKAMQDTGYSEQEIKEKIHSYKSDQAVYNYRYKSLSDSMSELRVELLEAEVHWGKEIYERMKPLNESIGKLRVNIFRLIRLKKRKSQGGIKLTKEERKEMDEVIYQISQDPEENAFTKEVHLAVEHLEEFIKPHLAL
mgnify:CR=1 FL=1